MIARKYIDALIVILACLVAIIVGSHVVTYSIPELSIITALVFTMVWAFVAGDYWWTPILTGATVGGVFEVGVKIYPGEVAVALAVIGLVPLILVRNKTVFQRQRSPLPLTFYLAAIFITIRLLIDIIPAQGARGTLGRIYFGAIWPFFFSWLFYHYGKASTARWAFGLMFFFLSIRSICAVIGYVENIPLYIPGINYVLSFSEEDSLVPMRYVAFILLLASLILFHCSRSVILKILIFPYFIFTSALVVMSSGRFMTLMMLILPVAFFSWARNWILLALFATFSLGTVVVFNLDPNAIEQLPAFAGRSVSGLLVKSDVSEAQAGTEGSDIWHSSLRTEGYHRWTQSVGTFLFGYGVVPSPDLYETKRISLDFHEIISISANVGSYESGFWSVVGVLGTVGFTLYTVLFFQLGRRLLPYFLQRPSGTLREGLVFWGCYTTFIWYATSNYQGSFPDVELVIMVIALAAIQDDKIQKKSQLEEESPLSSRGRSFVPAPVFHPLSKHESR